MDFPFEGVQAPQPRRRHHRVEACIPYRCLRKGRIRRLCDGIWIQRWPVLLLCKPRPCPPGDGVSRGARLLGARPPGGSLLGRASVCLGQSCLRPRPHVTAPAGWLAVCPPPRRPAQAPAGCHRGHGSSRLLCVSAAWPLSGRVSDRTFTVAVAAGRSISGAVYPRPSCSCAASARAPASERRRFRGSGARECVGGFSGTAAAAATANPLSLACPLTEVLAAAAQPSQAVLLLNHVLSDGALLLCWHTPRCLLPAQRPAPCALGRCPSCQQQPPCGSHRQPVPR
jgi:hypothetical protein